MPPGDEGAYREAVRAFGLAAADLTNPVPGLMADLTAPEERLRDLEREPPLVYFSPFEALPEDIAHDGGETGYAGTAMIPVGAEEPSRGTSENFSGRHEGSMNAVEARRRLDVPAT